MEVSYPEKPEKLLSDCAVACYSYGLIGSSEWCINQLKHCGGTKKDISDINFSLDGMTMKALMYFNKREYFNVIEMVNDDMEPNLVFMKYLSKFRLLNLNRFKESPFAERRSPEMSVLRGAIESRKHLAIQFNLLLAMVDKYISRKRAVCELVAYLAEVPYDISAIRLLASCVDNPYTTDFNDSLFGLSETTQNLVKAEVALLVRDERALNVVVKDKLKEMSNTPHGLLLRASLFVLQRDFSSAALLLLGVNGAVNYTGITQPSGAHALTEALNVQFSEIKEEAIRILADTLYVLRDEVNLGRLVSTLERIMPGGIEHLYSLANLMSLIERHSASLKFFFKALYLSPLGPEDTSILLLMGHEMIFMKRTRGALASYRLASVISPLDPRGPSCAGRVYEILGLNVHASELYKESIRRSPWDSRSWLVFGNATQDREAVEMSLFVASGNQPMALSVLYKMTKDQEYIKSLLAWVCVNDTQSLLAQINSDDIVATLQLASEYAVASDDNTLSILIKEASEIVLKHDANTSPFVSQLQYTVATNGHDLVCEDECDVHALCRRILGRYCIKVQSSDLSVFSYPGQAAVNPPANKYFLTSETPGPFPDEQDSMVGKTIEEEVISLR